METRTQESKLTELVKTFALSVVTSWPAMQIQYVGDKLFAGIDVGAGGDMTFYADDTDGETTVDPNIGINSSGAATTDGIIDLSTPHADVDTFGELKNHINGMADWRCFLIGVLPDGLTDDKFDTLAEASSHTIRSANGLTLYADEAASVKDQGFSISNQKFVSRPANGRISNRSGWVTDKLCVNTLSFLHVNLTVSGASNIELYPVDDINDTSQLMWENVTVSATVEGHGTTDPVSPFIIAPIGRRLLIFFDNAAAVTAADVHAIGMTRHITGGRVEGGNYTGMG